VTADSGDEEGIPVSLMEALASGLPAVSTRHSGIPELVRHEETGLLTDEGDAAALADAVQQLLDAPDEAERLSRAGHAWVTREFNQGSQVARVGAWLSRIVARGAAAGSAKSIQRSRRGLILQTIDPGLLARKLAVLTHRHADVLFDIVARDEAVHALAGCPGIGGVMRGLLDTGAAMTLTPGLEASLATAGYAIIVVPWSDEVGLREQWASDLASQLNPARVVCLTLRDRHVEPNLAASA
jgi:hypothetical protein